MDPVLPETFYIWFFMLPAFFAHFISVKFGWYHTMKRRLEIKFLLMNWLQHFDLGNFIITNFYFREFHFTNKKYAISMGTTKKSLRWYPRFKVFKFLFYDKIFYMNVLDPSILQVYV